ncbi:MAG: hypothetical protein ACXIUZ_07735 [Lysobacteraceae bacterium]
MRVLLVWVMVLGLAGCGPGLTPTRLDDPSRLPDRYGIVAVQVVSNTEQLAPNVPNWTAVFAVDLDDIEKRYRLDARGTGLLNSRVFIGALPPGRYALYNLHAFHQVGDVQRWMNAPVPRSLGSFDVVEDGLTSLGAIIFQPLYDASRQPRREGAPYLVFRVEDREDLSEFVADAHPGFFARLRQDRLLGWESGVNEPEAVAMLERLRRFAVGRHPHRAPDGTAVFGSVLGQLLWRTAEGSWERTDTGYVNEIAAVARDGDDWLLAGERGLVLRAASLDGPWQRLPGPGTQVAVYWLHVDALGRTHALGRSDSTVTFYRVEDGFTRWTPLERFQQRSNFFFEGSGEVHAAVDGQGRIALFGDRRRVLYDPDTGQLHSSGGRDYVRLSQQPDGTLVGVAGHWWSGFGRPEVSADLGASWSRIGQQVGVEASVEMQPLLPVLLPDGRELVLAHMTERHPTSGRIRRAEGIHTRLGRDGTVESWGARVEEGCERLHPNLSDPPRLLIAQCNDGRILSSPDLGESWTLERDPGVSDDIQAPQGTQA